MSRPGTDQHAATRDGLRTLGILLVVVGLALVAVGVGDFFSSMSSSEGPRYFWCALVGGPLLVIGASICKFAFLGAVTRYVANEVAPVGTDVANFLAEGTRGAVKTMAAAVSEGLHEGAVASSSRCSKCQTENDAAANFCKGCGAPIESAKSCDGCGTLNDGDAIFCKKCGQGLSG